MQDFSEHVKGITLSKEQNEAISRMVSSRNIILGHQAGLGKTNSALVSAKVLLDRNPNSIALIIPPKSARKAFRKELETRLVEPYALYSADEEIPLTTQRFLMVEQSILHKYMRKLEQLMASKRTITIVDEAHVLQNPKNRVSGHLRRIKNLTTVEWLLTATPLLNSIEGLYNVLNHSSPGTLGSWWEFRAEYCKTKQREIRISGGRKRRITEIVGYKDLTPLRDYINEVIISGSIDYDLNYYYLRVPLDDEFKVPYNESAKGVFDSEYMGEKEYGGRLHDLQRVVDGSHHTLLKHNLSNKEKALLKRVRKIMERNESALVYCEYEETINRLHLVLSQMAKWAKIRKIHVLVGKTKEEDRGVIEDTLQKGEVVLVSQAGRQCFAAGTKVLMSTGSLKNIEDIRIGDTVMGPDLEPRTVVETHQGISKMYTIEQKRADNYTVNENHILHFAVGSRYGRYQKGDLVNMTVKDFLKKSKSFQSIARGYKLGYEGVQKDRTKNHIWSALKIQEEGEGAYYGFAIDHEDGLFLLADGTVVHNSRNLQRANHIVMYNVPFSVGTIVQLIGRICRYDTTYTQQHIHILEVIDTIDTYKVQLFRDNVALINNLFGSMGVLPTDVILRDRSDITSMKRRYLWNKRR